MLLPKATREEHSCGDVGCYVQHLLAWSTPTSAKLPNLHLHPKKKLISQRLYNLACQAPLQSMLNFTLQVITVLNHAGVCVSYTTAWKYLRQLTIESRYLDIVQDGHWIWAYDNLNIRVRHERDGNYIGMQLSSTPKERPMVC